MKVEFEPIGVLHTCFKEKFGIPRQSGLVTRAEGILKLQNDPFLKQAVRELDRFSHIWVIFVFHQHDAKNWKPSIRPPRLGGAEKVGVLASRSPHRPNPIGLSACRLERIDLDAPGGVEIHLSGVDILDGTPVLDIKPYLPYADALAEAQAGWASAPIVPTPVLWTPQAEESVRQRESKNPHLRKLIEEILSLDPRPAFQKSKLPVASNETEETSHGFRLFSFDVKWKIERGHFTVLDVVDYEEVALPVLV